MAIQKVSIMEIVYQVMFCLSCCLTQMEYIQ